MLQQKIKLQNEIEIEPEEKDHHPEPKFNRLTSATVICKSSYGELYKISVQDIEK